MRCPCKDCTDRHIACHARCVLYKEYADKCEQIRQNRAENLHKFSRTSPSLQKSYKTMGSKFNFYKGTNK